MFSIIIPLYNKAETIKKSLDSVLAQTVQDYEVVIVNDGSTDNIKPFLTELHYPHVRVLTQQNSGVSIARNAGIINSRYRYICFLDADDLWLPNHLAVLQQMIAAYPAEKMFATAFRQIDMDGNCTESSNYLQGHHENIFRVEDLFAYMRTLHGLILHTNSICIERSAFEQAGMFLPKVSIGEDTDLWYRIAAYYPVVLSKTLTTEYHRQYSTATKHKTMTLDWPFAKREQELLAVAEIPEKKKQSIIWFIDVYRISKARHLLLAGCRAEAMSELLSVIQWNAFKMRILITALCFATPTALLNYFYNKKNAGHYQAE